LQDLTARAHGNADDNGGQAVRQNMTEHNADLGTVNCLGSFHKFLTTDSAFILEWTELNDLNTANDEGKTDLELVFSEEPDSVTAERWPAEDRGQNFGNGYPEGESVSVEHAESWSIPGAEAGYIYEVDAVFENGTVSYGFEVKK